MAVAVEAAVAGQGGNSGSGSTPEKQAYENYIKIQSALAADSLKAEKVAKANSVSAARAAFKALSKTLIDYRKSNPALMAQYHEVYCPMADASWLQTGKTVMNPYYGSSMLHCGEIKN
jgi:hypothetical protein